MKPEKEKTLPALYDLPWAIAGDGFEIISRAVEKIGAVEAILARPGIQMSAASRVSVRGRVAQAMVVRMAFSRRIAGRCSSGAR